MWLFFRVLCHHVIFQVTSCNAGKLTHCASVRLFPRVFLFVPLQIAWIVCSKVALIALMWFLSSVFHNVPSQMGTLICWKVALCALVRFLPSMNEEVSFQITSYHKWLVALWTIVLLAFTVGLPVLGKATATSKGLGTQVTRLTICHLKLLNCQLLCLSLFWYYWPVNIFVNINFGVWSLSLSLMKVSCGPQQSSQVKKPASKKPAAKKVV